ncbi:reprolysin-like metallopeptidase [Pseudomonas sp. RGM2987]|uniref:reprolysin-like metallopeptidase n=1 Tax=Pseudomonas sp. RGM2987 TaxID=2930090 RepID=UPI001FD6E923|nr:hypothetical protein [Pseudomonas sp. RGM2987]MCJ8202978.1 hypothetical protein [Pseudomonas sp. RGM2987]
MSIQDSFTATGSHRLLAVTLICFLCLLATGCRSVANGSQEDAPQPTSDSLYANAIGGARFERSAIKVEQGYTVESGNIYTSDGETGALVVVRSPEGAVIAGIDEPGKRGLLSVDRQGVSTFTAVLRSDSKESDTVDTREPMGRTETISAEHRYVDLLMAYSSYALSKMSVDPVAFALMQVEGVNLMLRNSLVTGVSLRLAAVNIFDVPFDTSRAGLSGWQSHLAPYRNLYKTDLNAGYGGWDGGTAGRAYRPGYTSALAWASSGFDDFAHEVAHNVGGRHCFDQNERDYNFGHDNGRTKTSLCYGSRAPYFSTPAVSDTHGLPLGNAQTADMARVWRENTARLSGYNAELPGERMILVSAPRDTTESSARLRIPLQGFVGGVVALSPTVGPTSLAPSTGAQSTPLRVSLKDSNSRDVDVVLRGIRHLGGCKGMMNASDGCGLGTVMELELKYYPSDNTQLPAGYYNGLVILEARKPDTDWKLPINISIAIKK